MNSTRPSAGPVALLLWTLLLGVTLVAGCSSGISDSTTTTTTASVASGNVLQGFDLGVTLSQPVTTTTGRGAVISASFGDLQVLFLAYVTAASAAEFMNPAPTDANGASDVYVSALVSLANSSGLPTAFNQELQEVFEHPRCQNCHGFPVTAPVDHPGGLDPAAQCSNCHDSESTGIANQAWFAPLTVGFDLDFRNKTAQELVTQINDWEMDKLMVDPMFTLMDHFNDDPRIEWAITSGTVPLGRPAKTPVPIGLQRFIDLMQAWDDAGRPATAASAIQSTVLVSQVVGGAAAASASSQPSVAFVPAVNPMPMDPVGTLYIAFVSSAADLPGTPQMTSGDNVFRAQVDVYLEMNDTIRLDVDPNNTTLVSFQSGAPGTRCNDACSNPAISFNGQDVAFESLATDLEAGFLEGNLPTEPDLYIYHQSPGPDVELLSAATSGATNGGDAGSYRPSMDGSGFAVAFESDASDLIAGDTNSQRDVFYRCLVSGGCGVAGIQRASVSTQGQEGVGGSSRNASIANVAGTVVLAFESNMTNLTSSTVSAAQSQVYLHDNSGGGTETNLLSKTTQGAPGNGNSTQPRLSPRGVRVAFETAASNLDDMRTDANSVSDVVLADLNTYLTDGNFTLQRASITAAGADGDAASTSPDLGSFERTSGAFEGEFLNFSTAATNLGASDTTGLVTVFVEPNFNPTCNIQAPTVALTAVSASFDGSGSSDPDGDAITSFEWDFGDGNSAMGAQVSHTFAVAGNYTTQLTVTDARGARSVCTQAVQVNFMNQNPVADPGVVADQAVGFVVNFDGSGSSDPDVGDSVVQYDWDFGDGNTSLGNLVPTTSHTYMSAGAFTVTLTVTDMFGGTNSDTTTANIFVNSSPSCSVTNVASIAEDNSVTFMSSAMDDQNIANLTYSWSVDGGEVQGLSTSEDLTVLYCAPGTWNVTLTVTDMFGATSMCSSSVLVTGTTINFDDVYTGIINGNCNVGGCHDAAGNELPAMSPEGVAFARLRNETGGAGALGSCVNNVPGLTYVDTVTFDPSAAASFLVDKVESSNPSCGGQMPDGGPPLSTCDIDTIKSWIMSGANP